MYLIKLVSCLFPKKNNKNFYPKTLQCKLLLLHTKKVLIYNNKRVAEILFSPFLKEKRKKKNIKQGKKSLKP